MSQRIVITDDHDNSEIAIERADYTRTMITLTRIGQEHSIAWPDLNLTDESWDKLIKVIREFVPDAQSEGQEQEAAPQSVPVHITPRPAAKRDGKAVRAWWHGLDANVLTALALPTPDRSVNIGKMPQAVYDAYDSAHS